MTLPRKKRVSRARFPKTKGARAFFGFGTVSFFPELAPSAAVIVPKKIFSSSVARHRAKRRVLNAIKRFMAGSKPRGGFVIYPNKNTLTARFGDLEEALQKTLNKLAQKS